ncbi:MAG: GNAT family N-acetyltransferase [Planctomycetaceae bacterium]|jgi:CelD/BcsL family acetyltransferase involved in cellulose biosynthesis|nr:GNAT family N-acetyltransferase [Planctomycetaceae bacterium]
MNARIITVEEELISLKDSWNRLVKSNAETDAPFFSWDWFYHSWQHFGKPQGWTLAVTAVFDGGKLKGILPLVDGKRKSCGVTYRTRMFCDVGMSPRNMVYFDPQCDQVEIFRTIFDELFSKRRTWDMIELGNIPETSSFHKFCLEEKIPYSALICWQGFKSPFIELGGTLDDYFESLEGKTRKDLRRRMRKFKDYGDAKVVQFFERPDEINTGLELLFEVHRHSWKGEFSNPQYREFYKKISHVLSQNGDVIVAVAMLNSVPISAGYILKNGDTYFSLVNDHDIKFREIAPGMILFVHELDYMIKTGIKKFDFCGTIYDYKEKLSGNILNHSTFQIFHNNIKSKFLYYAKTFWLPLFRKILRKPESDDLIAKIKHFNIRR